MIRELLDKDTPTICDALEAKVAEQEKRCGKSNRSVSHTWLK